jgi:hypothetical protein
MKIWIITRCVNEVNINFVVRDRYEMIAASLLHIQTKFELARCGSCRCMFCYSVTEMGKKHLEQRYAISFLSGWGTGLPIPTKRLRKCLVMIMYHALKLFRRHRDFINGRGTAEDEPRSGRPASVRTSTDVDRLRASFVMIDF